MFREGGYICISDPDSGVQEFKTFTCFHCNCIVKIKPRCNPDDLGGHCRLCDRDICPNCVGQSCTPFEKKLDLMEARDRALRSYGI